MFSNQESSNQKKRSASVIFKEVNEGLTPDEMTEGLNRLDLNKTRKLQRRTAQEFVNNEPQAITPEGQPRESIRFMDHCVQSVVDKYSGNPEVVKLAQAYRDAAPTQVAKAQALVKFERNVSPHIEVAQTTQAGIAVASALSNTALQVAALTQNRGLGRFATGVGAMTQAVNGIHQISQASSMLGAASGAATTMMSGATMLGAVGMVMSAGMLLASLFAEEDSEDNGLGEALSAIHGAVMAMWQDTRHNFEITWQRLDRLDEKITEMERQNRQRFLATLKVMNYYGEMTLKNFAGLEITLSALQGSLNYSQQRIESLVKLMTNKEARVIANALRLDGKEETVKKLTERSGELWDWLTAVATHATHSGQIPAPYGPLEIEVTTLIGILKQALEPQKLASLSLPMGLFASLARAIDATIIPTEKVSKIINTEDWTRTLACYLQVIMWAEPEILNFPRNRQAGYLDNVRELKEKPLLILDFLSNARASDNLWTGLIDDYQTAVRDIQTQIKTILETQRQALNREYNVDSIKKILNLEQSAQENFNRLEVNPEITQPLMNKDLRVILKETPVHVDNSLVQATTPWHPAFHGDFIREGQYLVDAQIDRILQETIEVNAGLRCRTVMQSKHFLVASAFQLTKLDLANFKRYISESNGYCIHALGTTVHVVLSLVYDKNKYPFLDVNFHPLYPANDHDRLNVFTEMVDNVSGQWTTQVVLRPEYDALPFNQLIEQDIEQKILLPQRKLAAEKMQLDFTQFDCARLKLLSFIRLFNPEFSIDFDKAKNSVLTLINDVKISGLSEPLQRLLAANFGATLLKADLGLQLASSDALLPLVRNVLDRKSLYEHRLWQTMAHAYASIEMLEQKLLQAPLLKERMQRTQIVKTIRDGMLLLQAQHQQFSDGLRKLQSVAERAQPLVATEIFSATNLSTLTAAIEQLEKLEDQVPSMSDDAQELRDDIGADYLPPNVEPTPTASAHALPEEKKRVLSKRIEAAKDSLGFSFDETINLLEQVAQQFQSVEMLRKPAVLLVGMTGAGKSTLANTCLGLQYKKEKRKAILVDATAKEYAKTGNTAESETQFPNFCTTEEAPYWLIDMAGFGDTRGIPEQITNSVRIEWIKCCVESFKGIVIVCSAEDMSDPKYKNLRTNLEAVGHMIKKMPKGIEQQVCLVITRSSNFTREEVYEDLEAWAASSEFNSSPLAKDKEAIKRALSIIIKSPDSILMVDVTEENAHIPLLKKIETMPINPRDAFSFSLVKEIKLIKTAVIAILSAKDEIENQIHILQYSLAKQLKNELDSVFLALGMSQELETVRQSLQDVRDENDAFRFTRLVDKQKEYIETAKKAMATLKHLFIGVKEANKLSQETTLGEALTQKYDELKEYSGFFNRIVQISRVLHVDAVKDGVVEEQVLDTEADAGYVTDNGVGEQLEKSTWVKSSEAPSRRVSSSIYHVFQGPLISARYLYTHDDIDQLLNISLEDQIRAKTVDIQTAMYPLTRLNDSDDDTSIGVFIAHVEIALKSKTPTTIIPINTTTQNISNENATGGTHWIALIVQPESTRLTFIDSLGSASTKTHQDIIQLITSRIDERFEITVTMLDQQKGDVDCGAWLIDNVVNFVHGQEFNNPDPLNRPIYGANLREKHQEKINKNYAQRAMPRKNN
jgi:energy-coupling factor transporter ATP-binding protein EcfA2